MNFCVNIFSLYNRYCTPVQGAGNGQGEQSMADLEKQRALEDPNLTRYAWVTEDKQADDITLIAIKRP